MSFSHFLLCYVLGAKVVPVQVVPQGIVSVNGSDINMGCASPLVDRGGVMVCDNSEGYLVDGCSPAIDTSTSNWASQLVTVKKNEPNNVTKVPHVVLIFDFDTAVSLDSIEFDLFLCREWSIGASGIFVYAYENSSLVFNLDMSEIIGSKTSVGKSKSQCDSLSTVRIGLSERVIKSYHSFHIVVDLDPEGTDWIYVHVGEVRFFSDDITNPGKYHNIYYQMSAWHNKSLF